MDGRFLSGGSQRSRNAAQPADFGIYYYIPRQPAGAFS